MSQKWRKFRPEFRKEELEKMKHCASVSELGRQLGFVASGSRVEKAASAERGPQEPVKSARPLPRAEQHLPRRIAGLEALTARAECETGFFRKCLVA
jgi:hypothetical protein